MRKAVIDLHCDLLGCIEHDETRLNFESREINCSVGQLLEGGVFMQTFAIATITQESSARSSTRQIELFEELLHRYPTQVKAELEELWDGSSIGALLAIENASSLAGEQEPLEMAFERFRRFSKVGKILYVSLTWNHENRFGGGNDSKVGLKPDGRAFLDFLAEYPVAIDLSHTSDRLAHDILDYIEQKSLPIVPMASHSNFRSIKAIRRNLPDELAQAIIQRNGLIGINFVRRFVGDTRDDFIRHIEHGLQLGGLNALALGSDFYGGIQIDPKLMPERSEPIFQSEFSHAGCHGRFLSFLQERLPLEVVENIAYKNALSFFKRLKILP